MIKDPYNYPFIFAVTYSLLHHSRIDLVMYPLDDGYTTVLPLGCSNFQRALYNHVGSGDRRWLPDHQKGLVLWWFFNEKERHQSVSLLHSTPSDSFMVSFPENSSSMVAHHDHLRLVANDLLSKAKEKGF